MKQENVPFVLEPIETFCTAAALEVNATEKQKISTM